MTSFKIAGKVRCAEDAANLGLMMAAFGRLFMDGALGTHPCFSLVS